MSRVAKFNPDPLVVFAGHSSLPGTGSKAQVRRLFQICEVFWREGEIRERVLGNERPNEETGCATRECVIVPSP
jgi:hypothetical protein